MSIESNKLMNLADGKVLYDDLRQRIEQGGGSVFVVTITKSGSTYSADKTYAEIVAAADENREVYAVLADNDRSPSLTYNDYYCLSTINKLSEPSQSGYYVYAEFTKMNGSEVDRIYINNYNGVDSVSVNHTSLVSDLNFVAPDYAYMIFPIAAGTPCTYHGGYYVAKVDIPTQEEFNSSHWDAPFLADEINSKAPIANPEFTGSISLDRAANSTVGEKSVAVGYGNTASGMDSFAEGFGTMATGNSSHSEGSSSIASGNASHAEGSNTEATAWTSHAEGMSSKAKNEAAHAEGSGTQALGVGAHSEGSSTYARGVAAHSEGEGTEANGWASHAEGLDTQAAGAFSHVSGKYNIPDNDNDVPAWVANTSYAVGDKVKVTMSEGGESWTVKYKCITANSDSEFDDSKWQSFHEMHYAEIVGNGEYNIPSNARTLDWDGNEELAGDLKVFAGTNNEVSVSSLKSAINVLKPAATASDVGKALIVKTVADGVPTSYEYGEAGGVDPQDIADAVDAWCDENITNPDSPPLDRSLTSSSAATPADITGGIVHKLQKVSVSGSANKWNKDTVKVGLVHTNGNVYTGGNYDNYKYNDPLPVQPGDEIRYYYINNGAITAGSMVRVVAYDSNDSVVSASSVSESSLYTVPNGISSVIITIGGTRNDSAMVIINDATSPSEYIPYDEGYSYYLATSDFIGDKQVKIKNCDFVKYSENLFDKTAVETGLLNKSTGALLTNYTNYATSDWIEVDGSTDYTFSSSYNTYLYWCWYDSDKEWISGGEKNIETEPTKQSPSTAKYIRFSLLKERINESIQFEKGSTASGYETFGHAYIKPEYIPPESMGFVCNLPKKIYALVGYETNIYFENIVEDWTKYKWDVSCSKGKQLERGYRITPEAADVGSYTLRFFLSIGDYTESFSTTLVVVGASAGSGVSESLIILGDSTTANGTAVTKLNANLASDVYSLSTIGTKGTSPNNHEGRSGWRLSNYFTTATDNAFYNPNTQTFDASYYFTDSGVAKPDWFFINLGINDVFGYSSDEDLNAAIEDCKDYLDTMIESINEASEDTKIGICLTIPPNHSQDAFGKEYNCGQNRNRYKRNNTLWVNALIKEYDDREDEGIYLVPIHAVLDTVYNMGMETLPVNARNTSVTYESPIGNGGVHPVESGYWQIADQYAAFLKGNSE